MCAYKKELPHLIKKKKRIFFCCCSVQHRKDEKNFLFSKIIQYLQFYSSLRIRNSSISRFSLPNRIESNCGIPIRWNRLISFLRQKRAQIHWNLEHCNTIITQRFKRFYLFIKNDISSLQASVSGKFILFLFRRII